MKGLLFFLSVCFLFFIFLIISIFFSLEPLSCGFLDPPKDHTFQISLESYRKRRSIILENNAVYHFLQKCANIASNFLPVSNQTLYLVSPLFCDICISFFIMCYGKINQKVLIWFLHSQNLGLLHSTMNNTLSNHLEPSMDLNLNGIR